MNYSINKALGIFSLCALVVTATNCGEKKAEQKNESTAVVNNQEDIAASAENTASKVSKVEAVCIWDNVSLRETPDPKGKYITAVNLGEKVTFLGETATDAKEKEYAKIMLADGKEGWSRKDFIIPEAETGAFLDDTDIYGRPDLLTKTKNKYSAMDIVAIVSTKESWVEVTGKRKEGKWIDKGWVKDNTLTKNPVDIAAAKFGAQAMAKEDIDERFEALKQLSENSDLASSVFMEKIQMGKDNILKSLNLPEEGVPAKVETPAPIDNILDSVNASKFN